MRHVHLLIAVSLIAANATAQPAAGPPKPGAASAHRHPGPPFDPSARGPQGQRPPHAPGSSSAGEHAPRPASSDLWRRLRERGESGDVKERLDKWKAAREERRQDRQKWLLSRWGQQARKPDVLSELRVHAQRLARLSRLEELAGTERTGEARQRLLERIDKLRERENQRHDRAMQRLTQAGPTPSAAAPASSGGAP